MFWLKSCPRCRGDLLRTSHSGEHIVSCLQCGRALPEPQAKRLIERPRPAQSASDAARLQESLVREPARVAAA